MQFRRAYINIYYQGHSILKMWQSGRFEISAVFTRNLIDMPESLLGIEDVAKYLELVPKIKDNVSCRDVGARSSASREVEFEQMLIRANNRERRNNSEYIILDRQYAAGGLDRWDLVALRWPREGRGTPGQEGHLSVIEVKYAQNPDIQKVKSQVQRYANYLETNIRSICDDMKLVLEQKISLGLLDKTMGQLDRLKKLPIAPKLEQTEIIVYLIDYNPHSQLVSKAIEGDKLDFSGKVHIVFGGLALWQNNLETWK